MGEDPSPLPAEPDEMTDDDRLAGGLLDAYVARVRYPRLVTTILFGLLVVVVAALLYGSNPPLAIRLGFIGAVIGLFGLSGLLAFMIHAATGGARD